LQLFFQGLIPFTCHRTEQLAPVMMDSIEQDRKEPRATIGPTLEAMERLPSLEINLLHHILSYRLLTDESPRSSKQIIQMR
jgi:hypothetical protein